MADWVSGPIASMDDDALIEAVVARFQSIFDDQFTDAIGVNAALPVEVRGLRRTEGWRIFLLLTPWMMSRLFVPERKPALPVPDEWCAEVRSDSPYEVMGPALDVDLLGNRQRAHINFDLSLGHYLIQPLVLAVEKYDSADAVFQAWNEVILKRLQVMEETQRECPWQREVSRREFFGRISRTGKMG